MKKLSFILALAFLLAPSVFAQCKKIERKSDGIYCDGVKGKRVEKKDFICSDYELNEDGFLYHKGKPYDRPGMGVILSCGSEIKGYYKAKRRQELQNKHNKK